MCGVTWYLQRYSDSCFLQGERIMCVESPGICRGTLTAVFCRVRGLCVWSHLESPGICSGTLTAVFCRVRGLCVWLFHCPTMLAATHNLWQVFSMFYVPCELCSCWSIPQLNVPGSPSACSCTLADVSCRPRGLFV